MYRPRSRCWPAAASSASAPARADRWIVAGRPGPGPQRVVAGGGGRGLRRGTVVRLAADGAELGRVGLRQPGERARASRLVRPGAGPRRSGAGRAGGRADQLGCRAAGVPVAGQRAGADGRAVDLAAAAARRGAGTGRGLVRRPMGGAVLRPAGHAGHVVGPRRPGRGGLLPARREQGAGRAGRQRRVRDAGPAGQRCLPGRAAAGRGGDPAALAARPRRWPAACWRAAPNGSSRRTRGSAA